ncbi:hypothetical protein B0H13DRAFT_2515943, partial [Mycena leptocephala]
SSSRRTLHQVLRTTDLRILFFPYFVASVSAQSRAIRLRSSDSGPRAFHFCAANRKSTFTGATRFLQVPDIDAADRNRLRDFHTLSADLPPLPTTHWGPLPTLLTQICRQWREIALATPVLWRGILFSQNITPSDVSHMLDRSRCCPLSIRMDAYSEGVQVSEFFATVVPHCTRWEYLKLRLLQTTFPPIKGAMPLLRHLDFAVQTLADGSDPNPLFIAPCELPLLRTVILNDVAALSVTLPVYIHECVPILQQMSNLVYCALELYSDTNDRQPDIALPYLKSLTSIAPKRTSLLRMNDLQIFIVPALLSLKIPERFLGLDPIDSLTSFISKSGCRLQEMCIAGKRLLTKNSYHLAFPLIQTFLFSGRSANDEEEGPELP